MNILVCNCGSSSLKYRLLTMPEEDEISSGEAQRIGPVTSEPARIVHREGDRETVHPMDLPTHQKAFHEILSLLAKGGKRPDALGHRVVHGGQLFEQTTVITPTVFGALRQVRDLAPLHNPPAIDLIEECQTRYASLPQVAVFDTAFHTTIPEHARQYALPLDLVQELNIRKYGFHGTSHQYVVEEAAKMVGIPMTEFNAVSCHLGSGGASLCAISKGRSIENTMGYTPLQGLVMSTRCGDLDPAIVMKLLSLYSGDMNRIEDVLNRRSGVLGLSGASADIRDILGNWDAATSWNDRFQKTLQIYLWRIRKYLGAYLTLASPVQAIIFTDTIGENVSLVRSVVCANQNYFGICLDEKSNRELKQLPGDISQAGSPVRILVVATNEELAIARQVFRTLSLNNKVKQ